MASSYAFNLATNLKNRTKQNKIFQISLIETSFLHKPKESEENILLFSLSKLNTK